MIYLDTHAAILLAQGDTARFSKPALRALNREDLLLSPAAVLELEFLQEIGRLRIARLEWDRPPGLSATWNPGDPGARLLARDEPISAHYKNALW